MLFDLLLLQFFRQKKETNKETNMSEIKPREETSLANVDLFYFSNFIFKKITVSLKKQAFKKMLGLRKN